MIKYLFFVFALLLICNTSVAQEYTLTLEESKELKSKTGQVKSMLETVKILDFSTLQEYIPQVIEPSMISVRGFLRNLAVKYGIKILKIACKELVDLIDLLKKELLIRVSNLSYEVVLFFLNLTDESFCIDYTKKKLKQFEISDDYISEKIYREYQSTIYLYGDTSALFCEQGVKALKAMKQLRNALQTEFKNKTDYTLVFRLNKQINDKPSKLTFDALVHISRRHLEKYYVIDNLDNQMPTFFEQKDINPMIIHITDVLHNCTYIANDRPLYQPTETATIKYNHKLYRIIIKRISGFIHSIHPKGK